MGSGGDYDWKLIEFLIDFIFLDIRFAIEFVRSKIKIKRPLLFSNYALISFIAHTLLFFSFDIGVCWLFGVFDS